MIEGLTLRAGSRYYVDAGAGGLAGPYLLEEDIEVNLLSSGSWRVYERTDGNPAWLYVKPADDRPPPPDA